MFWTSLRCWAVPQDVYWHRLVLPHGAFGRGNRPAGWNAACREYGCTAKWDVDSTKMIPGLIKADNLRFCLCFNHPAWPISLMALLLQRAPGNNVVSPGTLTWYLLTRKQGKALPGATSLAGLWTSIFEEVTVLPSYHLPSALILLGLLVLWKSRKGECWPQAAWFPGGTW